MSYSSKSLLLPLLVCAISISPSMFMARPIAITSQRFSQPSTLMARLKLDNKKGDNNSSSACWGSLFELRSCTGEVILFFMNGETYLGQDCCRAIGIIERHCWPSMLGSLGYTAVEGDILRGYCDAKDDESGDSAGSTDPQPPSPQRLVNDARNLSSHFLINP